MYKVEKACTNLVGSPIEHKIEEWKREDQILGQNEEEVGRQIYTDGLLPEPFLSILEPTIKGMKC